VQKGQVILARGHRLTPPALGLAASMGFATLPVARAPRVALFSTGDELVMPGTVAPEDMPPGAIYNSNRYVLYALLRRLGCEVSDLGLVPDTLAATQEALAQAAQGHDVVLTSGGVSVGEEDHIRPALQALGSLHLWQIAMKPGKPFAYGQIRSIQRKGSGAVPDPATVSEAHAPCHFLGLPGNPVSSLVTFLLLVRPFMLALQGVRGDALGLPEPISMPVHFDWPRADKRREFVRVRRNAAGGLDVYPTQSSGVLTSAVWADGLLDIPAGTTLEPGDRAMYRPLTAFFS
jgi:molybdopterin molybdotransferase